MPQLFSKLCTVAFAFVAACHTYPTPYSAAVLERDSNKDPAGALVHYLAQPNADGGVCAVDAEHRLQRVDAKVVRKLIKAIDEGRVSERAASDCLFFAFERLTAAERETSMRELSKRYLRALEDDRSHGLHAAVMRASEVGVELSVLTQAANDASDLVAGGRLSKRAASDASEFVSAVGVSVGLWNGRPVDAQFIAAETDRERLQMFVTRLPDPELAELARRRVIRLDVEASAYPEVVADADAVVDRVVSTGRNAVTLGGGALRSASLSSEALGGLRLVVEQEPAQGTASLHFSPTPSQAQLVPQLDLHGRLNFEVEGYQQPITLCRPAHESWTDPCVPATELVVDETTMSLSDDGVLTLRDRLPIGEALDFLADDGGFAMAFSMGDEVIAEAKVPLVFRSPGPVIRQARQAGEDGPNLRVVVDQKGEHFVFQILGANPTLVVIHRSALGRFFVASRGAAGRRGQTGARGRNGTAGRRGSDARCPYTQGGNGGNGTAGTSGGRGGDGGKGGDGGDVELVVRCGERCEDLGSIWRRVIRSEGGSGGAGGTGGAGGAGGAGGRGGSSTSCQTETGYGDNKRKTMKRLSGGSNGQKGQDGMSGMSGASGASGKPGRVRVVYE